MHLGRPLSAFGAGGHSALLEAAGVRNRTSSGVVSGEVSNRPAAAALIGMLLLTLPSSMRPPAAEAAPLRDRLDRYAKALTDAGRFGGAVAVVRDGRVLLMGGYGYADIDARSAITEQTPFPLASVTKQMTAVAVLQLHAQGRLSLTESVCVHVPRCPRRWRPIRIRQLLNHSAGLADGPSRLTRGTPRGPSLNTAIERLKDRPLLFRPGRDYLYSNAGYELAGYIVARASGVPYGEYLRKAIIEPAGMTATDLHRGGPVTGAMPVVGYTTWLSRSAQLRPAPTLVTPFPDPAGGVRSTAEDLVRYDRALAEGRLLSAELRRKMFRARGPARYGFGWESYRQHGHTVTEHGGAMPGFRTCLSRYNRERLTVIVLSNRQEVDACERMASDLAGIAFGRRIRVPRLRRTMHVPRRVLVQYAGRYRSSDPGDPQLGIPPPPPLRIKLVRARLVAMPAGPYDRATILRPVGRGKFVSVHQPDVLIAFARDQGRVSAVEFHHPSFKGLPPMVERLRRIR